MLNSLIIILSLNINTIQSCDTINIELYLEHLNDSPSEFRNFIKSVGFHYKGSESYEMNLFYEDIFQHQDSLMIVSKGFTFSTIYSDKGGIYNLYPFSQMDSTNRLNNFKEWEKDRYKSYLNFGSDKDWEKISITGIYQYDFDQIMCQIKNLNAKLINGYWSINLYKSISAFTVNGKYLIIIAQSDYKKDGSYALFIKNLY